MSLLYAGALAVSIAGMALLDRRSGLFFAADARRAAIVLAVGVAFFLVWDVAGIALGVFFRGRTPYMSGLLLAPELPVEELLFLVLLVYVIMAVYGALLQRSSRVAAATAARSGRDAP